MRLRRRVWRYAPLLVWIVFIFYASSGEMSASNTSRLVRPLLLWLFPTISEDEISFAHVVVRKGAHLTEYAVLAVLAARAFITSSVSALQHNWFGVAFALVAALALLDELNQSFEPSRTGTIVDSFIDMIGGAVALTVLALWQRARQHQSN